MNLTISKLFNGKKIQVDEFKRSCQALKLESEWQEITGQTHLNIDEPESG
jgi:hypothetical protein